MDLIQLTVMFFDLGLDPTKNSVQRSGIELDDVH